MSKKRWIIKTYPVKDFHLNQCWVKTLPLSAGGLPRPLTSELFHVLARDTRAAVGPLAVLWGKRKQSSEIFVQSKPSNIGKKINSSAKLQSLPLSEVFFCLCDKVYHKQEVCFHLYLLGHIVT